MPSFGDVMAWASDLRLFTTGTAAVAVAASAVAMLSLFLITMFVKSRPVRIIGDLGRQQKATTDARSPEMDNPIGSRIGSFEDCIKEIDSESNAEDA